MRQYTERISFTVPFGVKSRLKNKAAAMGISMSELVRRISERPDNDVGQKS